ncbi:MAG TPA: hypothetical protein VKY26_02450, partial [Actinomycetota bacterium]|nr:hypothetical protein [Actinomycetota bacterium]
MADAEPAAVFAVANAAIVRGDAPGAIAAIDAALALGADPELHLLRGQLAYLLCDWEPARAHFESAVRVFEALNRLPRAALTASWLGRLYFDGIGHQLAARGWFARADRLLEQEGPCVERGWVAIPVVGCSVANVDELEQKARLALEVGRQFGDAGLEAKALADGGLALVTHGRVRQGMSWLDEAMAMVTGGLVENPVAATGIRCCVMSACERCGDLGRAEAWLSMMDERNPILYSHCRIALASLFCELGRWGEADVILQQVVEVGGLNTHKNRVMAQA